LPWGFDELRAAMSVPGAVDGDAKVKFLPPYSPDFSSIEKCWSKVKTFLRRVAARTQKDLDAARLWGCTQLKTAIVSLGNSSIKANHAKA
jgi:transposase